MNYWSPNTVPSFSLRRDFADEAGLGAYLLEEPYREKYAPRRPGNRALFLSPGIPQYLAYDLIKKEQKIRITFGPDCAVLFSANGIFQDLLDRVAAYVRQTALDRAPAAQLDPLWSIIQTEDWRTYTNLVLHCSHSGRAWIVPYSQELMQFLRHQD